MNTVQMSTYAFISMRDEDISSISCSLGLGMGGAK